MMQKVQHLESVHVCVGVCVCVCTLIIAERVMRTRKQSGVRQILKVL